MPRSSSVRAAIILSLCLLVNGGAFAETPSLKKRVEKFVASIMSKGENQKLGAGRAKFLDIEAGTPTKVVGEADTADGIDRSCEVCLEKPKSKKVKSIILLADIKRSKTSVEKYNFKLAPDGSLQKVVKTSGEFREGQPVKGSGRVEEVSINAPGVREVLDRELAFWLDGKGRRDAAASKDAKLVPAAAAARQ
jgi:hypothetical protein